MNLTDLTEVMRDRAAERAGAGVTLAGIEAKVKARQRGRTVTAAACVVLAVIGAIYVFAVPGQRSSEPADTKSHGFAEYAGGTRLTDAASVQLPTRSVSLRFVPTSLDFGIRTRCDVGPGRRMLAKLTINGHDAGDSLCDARQTAARYPSDVLAARGVVAGRPTELTLSAVGELGTAGRPSDLQPVPGAGTLAIAVGSPVAPQDYSYPPRPDPVPDLGATYEHEKAVLRGDPADPNRPRETTLAWPGPRAVGIVSNTPGRLTVLLNGVEVERCDTWAYEVGGCPGGYTRHWPWHPREGEQVTIRVVPERQSGDWAVALIPEPR